MVLGMAAIIFVINVVFGLRYRSRGGDVERLGTIMLLTAPLVPAILVYMVHTGAVE